MDRSRSNTVSDDCKEWESGMSQMPTDDAEINRDVVIEVREAHKKWQSRMPKHF